jgi:hypothetical protein
LHDLLAAQPLESPHPDGLYANEWPDGSSYRGEWRNGKKDGQGAYTWTSGSVYEGEWLAGAMHGKGTYTAADGTVYTGAWQRDLKHGLGAPALALAQFALLTLTQGARRSPTATSTRASGAQASRTAPAHTRHARECAHRRIRLSSRVARSGPTEMSSTASGRRAG